MIVDINKSKELQEFIARIKEQASIAKIYCFGSKTITTHKKGCFEKSSGHDVSYSYDLVVLISQNEHLSKKEIEVLIEECYASLNFVSGFSVFTIIETLSEVEELLLTTDMFYTMVVQKGELLYDVAEPLFISDDKRIEQIILERQVPDWHKRFRIVFGLINGAEFYVSSNNFGSLALFMLHQAVELSSTYVLNDFTGYVARTHDLKWLLRFLYSVSNEFESVFPLHSRDGKDVIGLLNAAYRGARYNSQYRVMPETVKPILKKVRHFLAVCHRLYKEKVTSSIVFEEVISS